MGDERQKKERGAVGNGIEGEDGVVMGQGKEGERKTNPEVIV